MKTEYQSLSCNRAKDSHTDLSRTRYLSADCGIVKHIRVPCEVPSGLLRSFLGLNNGVVVHLHVTPLPFTYRAALSMVCAEVDMWMIVISFAVRGQAERTQS